MPCLTGAMTKSSRDWMKTISETYCMCVGQGGLRGGKLWLIVIRGSYIFSDYIVDGEEDCEAEMMKEEDWAAHGKAWWVKALYLIPIYTSLNCGLVSYLFKWQFHLFTCLKRRYFNVVFPKKIGAALKYRLELVALTPGAWLVAMMVPESVKPGDQVMTYMHTKVKMLRPNACVYYW